LFKSLRGRVAGTDVNIQSRCRRAQPDFAGTGDEQRLVGAGPTRVNGTVDVVIFSMENFAFRCRPGSLSLRV
jgi:hypothetical protein